MAHSPDAWLSWEVSGENSASVATFDVIEQVLGGHPSSTGNSAENFRVSHDNVVVSSHHSAPRCVRTPNCLQLTLPSWVAHVSRFLKRAGVSQLFDNRGWTHWTQSDLRLLRFALDFLCSPRKISVCLRYLPAGLEYLLFDNRMKQARTRLV